MKRFVMLLAAGIAASVLAGCATTGTAVQTPAEVAARICPPTQVAITSLQALEGLSDTAVKDLAAAAPIVASACAATTTVSPADLKSLATAALPAIVTVAKASPLPQEDKNRIILSVTAAQIVLAAVVASLPPSADSIAPASGAVVK